MDKTATVLERLRGWQQMATDRYGSQFRWVMLVGDISAMYDEIDPLVACDALRQAIHAVGVAKGRLDAKVRT